MQSGKSSFRMGNEFNAYGEGTYLKAHNQNIYTPLTDHYVNPKTDVGYLVPKVLGTMPIVINPEEFNPVLLRILGAGTTANQVQVSFGAQEESYIYNINVYSSFGAYANTSTRAVRSSRSLSNETVEVILGSPEYMEELQEILDDFAAEHAWKYGYSMASQMTAAEGINKIMSDVNSHNDISSVPEEYWLALCRRTNGLVQRYSVIYKELHYFRNKLNRAPESLDEMIRVNRTLPSGEKWRLLPASKAIYHMYGTNGEYNLKFVSADGLFEAVYNKAGVLLTEVNDAINMGTYNYVDPDNWAAHFLLDVTPYYSWGNVEGVPKPDDSAGENLTRYNNNDRAQAHYNNIKNQINN